MAQPNDYTLSNQVGASYRAEHNDINEAILSANKGSTAPSYAIAGTIWIDDSATPWLVKRYDGSDWITEGEIDSTGNNYRPYFEGTVLDTASTVKADQDLRTTDAVNFGTVRIDKADRPALELTETGGNAVSGAEQILQVYDNGQYRFDLRDSNSAFVSNAFNFTANASGITGHNFIIGNQTVFRLVSDGIRTSAISFDGGTNWLGDFEEGTFTPTLIGNLKTGSNTYDDRDGFYQRIGNWCHINLHIRLTDLDSEGDLQIDGLPFTAEDGVVSGIALAAFHANIGSKESNAKLNVQSNRIQMGLSDVTPGVGNTSIFLVSGTYKIN